MNVKINSDIVSDCDNIDDPVLKSVKKFEKHPSIRIIKNTHSFTNLFEFKFVALDELQNEILLLNTTKATPKDTIPVKIIKDNLHFFSYILYNNFNNSLNSSLFPDRLKLADVSPVFKNGNKNDKLNYRPVSILPTISKIYERLIFYQVNEYFDSKLSPYQCGFRKNYSTQYCLILMLEKWKRAIDNGDAAGALLTDMSKAFDCLSHELLIAKLEAYGFSYCALKLIHSYLTMRFQRVRINSNYSTWSDIISGVPQGSILGPLLFNIYLADLFISNGGINYANYADDNTPYVVGKDLDYVITKLKHDSQFLFNWLSDNALKANPKKSHLLLNSSDTTCGILINDKLIFNENLVDLLGITIDNDLSFKKHVTNLCLKASQKLHALSRVASYMTLEQRRLIMKSFIQSQFGYCPLIWMCHNRQLNNRINRIHERSLRVVYRDNLSSFDDLLYKDKSVSVHHRNLQILAIELFKVKNGIAPSLMNEIFTLKENVMYSSKQAFVTHNVRTVRYGTETLTHLGPAIWLIIPDDIKESISLNEFKNKIKYWTPKDCPCRLCKVYITGVGFI